MITIKVFKKTLAVAIALIVIAVLFFVFLSIKNSVCVVFITIVC